MPPASAPAPHADVMTHTDIIQAVLLQLQHMLHLLLDTLRGDFPLYLPDLLQAASVTACIYAHAFTSLPAGYTKQELRSAFMSA